MAARIRTVSSALTVVAIAVASAGCSTDLVSNIGNASLLPSASQFARPDWLTYSGGREDFALRPVSAADMVSQDGQCAVSAEDAAATQVAAAQPTIDYGAGGPRDGGAPDPSAGVPTMRGGIALQMTECQVVRRAGQPERLEFGTSDRGERGVTMIYTRGERPGIYRFSGGRLMSVERAPEAPPTARQKAPAKKKKSQG